MKQRLLPFLFLIPFLFACAEQKIYVNTTTYSSYAEYPIYEGTDLGITYTPQKTLFKLWSPAVQEVKINIYERDLAGLPIETIPCYLTKSGVWEVNLTGDYGNKYYTIQAKHNQEWSSEQTDPYAKAVGTNGKRGMIVDFEQTNPANWSEDKAPQLDHLTDAIIYELHIRDLSISPTSGIQNKGKYLAFTENGTRNADGLSTGIDHITELGVTHVHLLPAFDYFSVDESKLDIPQFNWGYDPQNYNAPEGSYSTNPADGKVRISEFKQMVQAMHKKGLRVVMDVVYNHTGFTHDSNLDQLVPGYYYRQWEDGKYANASDCGNETASERPMVRKFILESVKYWTTAYHIDGFRFDLMGIHDQETMNLITTELKKIDPLMLIYGEGWTASNSPLPEAQRGLKKYAYKMLGLAVFSDDLRDGTKGDVFVETSKGFVNGNPTLAESVKFGIIGAGQHPQINYNNVNYSKAPYATNPHQVINYVSCHDNHTLYDKLKLTLPTASDLELTRLNALSNTIVLTSQGIPFIHAGEEMNRTKFGSHNSYNLPDSINQINWGAKKEQIQLVTYYQNLISLRKHHPAFRITTNSMVQELLHFEKTQPEVIAYTLNNHANGDRWEKIYVAFNGSKKPQPLNLPKGSWTVALKEFTIDENGFGQVENKHTIAPQSALILFQGQSLEVEQ